MAAARDRDDDDGRRLAAVDEAAMERMWRDPTNWRCFGSVYSCRSDKRLFVPKQTRWMGWTLNFSNPWSIPTLGALVGIPAAIAVAVASTVKRG